MKRSIKYAGICGSFVFLMLAWPSMLVTGGQPWRVYTVALPGAILATVLGFQVGHILDNPRPDKRKKQLPAVAAAPPSPPSPTAGGES
jgi:hypothetical protein